MPPPIQTALELSSEALPRRRGRPPGRRNKRSVDLARYVEAMFAGQTPGQQSAELAMVKPRDLARAKGEARELGILELDLPPLMLAMVVKATKLARALGCDTRDAWLLLQKERMDLMPYIHQRQAPMAESKAKPPATVFLIPEGEAAPQLADFTPDDGMQDEIEFAGVLPPDRDHVGQAKSDDDA